MSSEPAAGAGPQGLETAAPRRPGTICTSCCSPLCLRTRTCRAVQGLFETCDLGTIMPGRDRPDKKIRRPSGQGLPRRRGSSVHGKILESPSCEVATYISTCFDHATSVCQMEADGEGSVADQPIEATLRLDKYLYLIFAKLRGWASNPRASTEPEFDRPIPIEYFVLSLRMHEPRAAQTQK